MLSCARRKSCHLLVGKNFDGNHCHWLKQCKRTTQSYHQINTSLNTTKHNKSKLISSNHVRQAFIDYFHNQHGHTFYRSSPVKPNSADQSLLFVNAGMNQFKPVFLDQMSGDFEHLSSLKRAVNSQKCIRVGGKHCDLETVGADFTHHTFFEMLGNWSFNDYFKNEACEMSWNLLTKVYGIDPSRLFVTIFGGNNELGLDIDLETYEIWRSIGVPANRIVPLGMKDNFWEMGETGPCGICTEIHYLLEKPDENMKNNEFLLQNSTEIWNIVFIQYFRDIDGKLNRLGKNFVDTGMGLERILSLVQNVPNNYATDLFTPYFDQLELLCKWPSYSHTLNDPKDIAYRILADHSRMTCVAIADQVMPDDRGAGYLLRRVIRRAIEAIRTLSNYKSLPIGLGESEVLCSLADTTIQTLGQAFPELNEQSSTIKKIIDEEVRFYTTAIVRNVHLMKLARSLEIVLNENSNQNSKEIIRKLKLIETKLSNAETKLSEDKSIDQKELDLCRNDLQSLQQLINNDQSLATRFGLRNESIDQLYNQLDLKFIQFENDMNKVMQSIIGQFEAEADRNIFKGKNYSVLTVSNDLTEYRPVNDLLLKISLDLYGDRPLAFLLQTEDSLLVQMTVPGSYQSSLQANAWFDQVIEKTQKEMTFGVQIEQIQTKRAKKLSKYRCTFEGSSFNERQTSMKSFAKHLRQKCIDIGKSFENNL